MFAACHALMHGIETMRGKYNCNTVSAKRLEGRQHGHQEKIRQV